MLILLPPSETKRPGGSRTPLDLDRLGYPELRDRREAVLDALVRLSEDPDAARVLRLGASQRDQVRVNAAVRGAPTLPAMDRYTGVLFDALDAGSLDVAARRWLARSVVVHSAPLGPVRAGDRIPDYRLGAGVRLPGLPPLRRFWADAVTAALAREASPFALDLRSEAYVALGPVPGDVPSAYVRVVTQGEDGATRALNHFNKHAKGVLVRRLAEQRPRIASLRGFQRWADAAGVRVRPGAPGELELFA